MTQRVYQAWPMSDVHSLRASNARNENPATWAGSYSYCASDPRRELQCLPRRLAFATTLA